MNLQGIIPESAVRHEGRDTSTLLFKDGTREFHIRGAVCWPVMVSGQNIGAALVAGLDIERNRVAVLCETTFATIDTVLDPERHTIISAGVGPWFNAVWQRFYAYKFFVEAGANGQHDRYGLEVRAANNIQPQPRFVQIDQRATWFPTLNQYLAAKRLVYPKDGMVHQQVILTAAGGPDAPTNHPVMRALGVCLAGFMEKPWRKGDVEYANPGY